MKRTKEEILNITIDVYTKVFKGTESFNEGVDGDDVVIGTHLAYLLGTIASNDHTRFSIENINGRDKGFYKLLKRLFPRRHYVWDYIEVEK